LGNLKFEKQLPVVY